METAAGFHFDAPDAFCATAFEFKRHGARNLGHMANVLEKFLSLFKNNLFTSSPFKACHFNFLLDLTDALP